MTESLKAYATAETKQLKVTQIRSGIGGT